MGRVDLRSLISATSFFLIPAIVCGSSGEQSELEPAWWGSYGVTTSDEANDFGPANIGQLKHIATQAKAYLDEQLDLSSSDWDSAFASVGGTNPFPFSGQGEEDNLSPVNLGQLKFIGGAFYQILHDHVQQYDVKTRLLSLGLSESDISDGPPVVPWTQQQTEGNMGLANVGQLKLVFSFEIPNSQSVLDDLNSISVSQMSYSLTGGSLGSSWEGFFDTDEIGDGWYYSSWFGWFWELPSGEGHMDLDDDGKGWVYHTEFGWIYLIPPSDTDSDGIDESVWFYMPTLSIDTVPGAGWCYANQTYSPNGNDDGQLLWVYFSYFESWLSHNNSPYSQTNRFTYIGPDGQGGGNDFNLFQGPGFDSDSDGLPDIWEMLNAGSLETYSDRSDVVTGTSNTAWQSYLDSGSDISDSVEYFTYDQNGQIARRLNTRGDAVAYAFDPEGNLISVEIQ